MTKPSLHIMKRPMIGRSPDDNDHGATNCFLPRSRRSTTAFSNGAAAYPLPLVLAKEIVPARVAVLAAAVVRLLFAGARLTATLARAADIAQRGRLRRQSIGGLCPNMALVGIVPSCRPATIERSGR
jgi:hypothetical protein